MSLCPAGTTGAECGQLGIFVVLFVVVFIALYTLEWWWRVK